MTDPDSPLLRVDTTVPNAARMYDYYLGGKNNYKVDREAAEKIMALGPSRHICVANRRFLGRAVREASARGIRQFLDLGTGLPTQENVHEVAKREDPEARVVYVDYDPVVRAHAQALRMLDETVTVIEQDVRDPEAVLNHPDAQNTIDFSQPVAVLFIAILHCLTDEEDPWGVLRTLTGPLVPGSMIAVSHLTDDAHPEEGAAAREVYDKATAPLIHRSHADVARFFEGFEVLEPGVTQVNEWRPEDDMDRRRPGGEWFYVGMGRKS
ncbi:SAM-dependent methyltransferase [Streptomyces sp. WMMC500]|uniref:SAM-dependent methyltransferase n=1 Tax=Streptomyces sp. WMMC500 TaxID=3015154 RepID=UPI00248CC443|nr:SAM-dependent methyltransferase [Streptomyces sp. WMMC500]WBB58324.1 SAM-dependent methyltransferase [Streptomyces sp. WMMC500]